jgi:hypothetical protein
MFPKYFWIVYKNVNHTEACRRVNKFLHHIVLKTIVLQMPNVQKSKKAKKYIVVAKLSDGLKVENTEKKRYV